VRKREGVEARDGIDTLLVALLCEAGAQRQLRAFAAGRNAARVTEVSVVLQEHGETHVLALLHANNGEVAVALRLWKVLSCLVVVCLLSVSASLSTSSFLFSRARCVCVWGGGVPVCVSAC
jgi:hypothetical protein